MPSEPALPGSVWMPASSTMDATRRCAPTLTTESDVGDIMPSARICERKRTPPRPAAEKTQSCVLIEATETRLCSSPSAIDHGTTKAIVKIWHQKSIERLPSSERYLCAITYMATYLTAPTSSATTIAISPTTVCSG